MVRDGFTIATTQSSKLREDSVEMDSPTKKPLGVSYWRIFPTAIMPPKVEIDGFFTVIQQCCWGQNSSWLLTFAQKWVFFFFFGMWFIFSFLTLLWLSFLYHYFILFYFFFYFVIFSLLLFGPFDEFLIFSLINESFFKEWEL